MGAAVAAARRAWVAVNPASLVADSARAGRAAARGPCGAGHPEGVPMKLKLTLDRPEGTTDLVLTAARRRDGRRCRHDARHQGPGPPPAGDRGAAPGRRHADRARRPAGHPRPGDSPSPTAASSPATASPSARPAAGTPITPPGRWRRSPSCRGRTPGSACRSRRATRRSAGAAAATCGCRTRWCPAGTSGCLLTPGSAELLDLGSANGITLNDEPVARGPWLPGDRLRIGDTVLGIEFAAVPLGHGNRPRARRDHGVQPVTRDHRQLRRPGA